MVEMKTETKIQERFWNKVQKTDNCWLWRGSESRNGYGQFNCCGKRIPPHRFTWELTHGTIPNGAFIFHRCENLSCVNPDHLFLEKTEERFWDKVHKTDACWIWQASKDGHGYGQFYFNGKLRRAHRVAWILTNGNIPDDMCILHHCDNPICVNPNHLFSGSQADNIHDCEQKGRGNHRGNKGEAHSRVKLTNAIVLKIRKCYAMGNETQESLGRSFGVSHGQIGRIINKKSWAWLN